MKVSKLGVVAFFSELLAGLFLVLNPAEAKFWIFWRISGCIFLFMAGVIATNIYYDLRR